jgi:hypothetical protein
MTTFEFVDNLEKEREPESQYQLLLNGGGYQAPDRRK